MRLNLDRWKVSGLDPDSCHLDRWKVSGLDPDSCHFPSVAKSCRFISRDGNNFIVEAKTKAFFGSKTFAVRMEGKLLPPEGFTSINTSSLGVEHEVFTMEEVSGGRRKSIMLMMWK